jgi:hypothetical protein
VSKAFRLTVLRGTLDQVNLAIDDLSAELDDLHRQRLELLGELARLRTAELIAADIKPDDHGPSAA